MSLVTLLFFFFTDTATTEIYTLSLHDALPISTIAPESPRATVDMGDLGYWPPGKAFCIFFGTTPASQGDEIRPASPVNVLGRVDGDATVFKKIRAGAPVRIERA